MHSCGIQQWVLEFLGALGVSPDIPLDTSNVSSEASGAAPGSRAERSVKELGVLLSTPPCPHQELEFIFLLLLTLTGI